MTFGMQWSRIRPGVRIGRRVGWLAVLLFIAPAIPGRAAFESTCSAAKLKGQGLAMAQLLTCYAKDVKDAGHVSNPLCLPESALAIASAFAKADAGGVCDGDPSAAAAVTAASADQLTATLAPLGLGVEEVRCAAAKLRAAGTRALRDLKCFVKAIHKSTPVDPACRFAARARLAKRFAAEERKGNCATVADADAVEALVDGFVTDALTGIAPQLIP